MRRVSYAVVRWLMRRARVRPRRHAPGVKHCLLEAVHFNFTPTESGVRGSACVCVRSGAGALWDNFGSPCCGSWRSRRRPPPRPAPDNNPSTLTSSSHVVAVLTFRSGAAVPPSPPRQSSAEFSQAQATARSKFSSVPLLVITCTPHEARN